MENKVKNLFRATMIALFAVILVSCSSKLTPLSPSLFSVTPSPLEVQGSKIPVTVNGKFPEKWFNKNAEITITPVLKWGITEQLGTAVTYQGENIAGNGIVVPQKQGAAFTIKSQFDYDPDIVNPALYLRFTTLVKNKPVTLPDVKIAEGLITTAELANALSNTPADAPDNFQKLIKDAYDANIMFLIQQAELRADQLNSSDLSAWKSLVKNADNNARQNVNVEVLAYASPDGGYELNNKLAQQREKNTTGYLNKEFQKEAVNTSIYANYTAQDWEGFKKLVEASNLQDKDLILRVIAMYQDPADREREIKNISIIYKDLAETILPQLRRSRLIANIETVGRTDSELIQVFNTNPSGLTIEELLYLGTLQGTPQEKIYTVVTQRFPADYRGWNNLGAYYFANNQTDAAQKAFLKAQQINNRAAEPNLNLGLLAMADGDILKAEQLIASGAQANTSNEALGLLYLKKGDYNKAIQSFGKINSNNAALAQILNKNYNQASQILNNISNKDGITHYLEAIVAARTNDATGVAHHLKSAFEANPSLKHHAMYDLEFAKFAKNSTVSFLFD